jgi:hypothetical protein
MKARSTEAIHGFVCSCFRGPKDLSPPFEKSSLMTTVLDMPTDIERRSVTAQQLEASTN